jgi:gamma-glutamyltranspeptidase/glutathione hydrolase
VDSADSQHLQDEAIRLALRQDDRPASWPERSAMEVTTESLLDDAYLSSRAKADDMKRRAGLQGGQHRSRAARST